MAEGGQIRTVYQLGRWHGGGTPAKAVASYWGGDIPWVSPKDMTDGAIRDTLDRLTEAGAARLELYSPGDIAVVFRSGILRRAFPVARGAVPFAVNQDLKVLHPDPNVDAGYAFHVLRGLERHVVGSAVKSGTTVESVDSAVFYQTPVHVPRLAEQRAITEVLDTVDEEISWTTHLIAKLNQIKEGMLIELFARGIDDNGELRDPQLHPEQFEASPLGPIPRDWTVERLGAVATKIQDGTHFSPQSSDGAYRYVTSKNVRFGFLDLSNCGWISESEHRTIFARCDVRAGDVLLTKDGANTGNAALNTLTEQFSLLSSVALVRLNPERDSPALLLQYLLSPVGHRRIKDAMSGLAITRLTLKTINQFLVPRPSHDEQLRIAEPLAAMDDRLQQELLQVRKLQGVKDGLAQDLLSGRVRATGANNGGDE